MVADPNRIRSCRFPAAKAGEHRNSPWTFAAHVPWIDAADDARGDGGCGQSATSTWVERAWSEKKRGNMGKHPTFSSLDNHFQPENQYLEEECNLPTPHWAGSTLTLGMVYSNQINFRYK